MFSKREEGNSRLETISKYFTKFKILPQIFAAFAATLNAFGMGTVEAYPSPALPSINSTHLGPLSEEEYARIASFALLAAITSGIPTCILLEKIGRKATMLLMTIPFITGWLLITFAVNLTMIDIGRVLTGFCAGSASMTVPVFLGEVAEDRIRGFLGSSFQFQVTAGNLFVYILGKYLNWQWLAFSCSLVILAGLLLMIFVPQSPRYLLSKGRVKGAAKSLVWLRGAETVEQIENELLTIKNSVDVSTKERGKLRDYFRLPILRPMLISLLLLFFQQMTGVEAILVYTFDIFTYSGSILKPDDSVIIVGCLQVITTFLSALIVDKVGRRLLLLISSLGTSISMAGLGAWFYHITNHCKTDIYDGENDDLAHDWIPLLATSMFIIFFSIGLGPIPFIMIAELNNSKMVGIVSAITTTFNWTFAYLVTRYFLMLAKSLGFHSVFWGFTGLSLFGTVFIAVFVPETKGKSMDDIQRYFKAI